MKHTVETHKDFQSKARQDYHKIFIDQSLPIIPPNDIHCVFAHNIALLLVETSNKIASHPKIRKPLPSQEKIESTDHTLKRKAADILDEQIPEKKKLNKDTPPNIRRQPL